MNEIEELLNLFEEKLLEISILGSFIVDESTKQYIGYLKKLDQQFTTEKNIVYLDNNKGITGKRLVYFDILNEHEKTSGNIYKTKNIDELYDDAIYYMNRQLQWLFVETYELYEKYIDDLYSLIGYLDNNFWDLEDFGKISISEIKNLTQEKFKNLIVNKKDKPYSIIKIFEKKLNLKKYYNINDPFCNYDFLMRLLSEFRNTIVHDKGFLNKEKISKIIKSCGINEESLNKKHEDFIFNFLGTQKYENMICLTKVKDEHSEAGKLLNKLGFMGYDRFKIILEILFSYIKFISDLSLENLNSIKQVDFD